MAYLVQCNQCQAATTVSGPMTDPDAAVSCGCCPQAHDHAAAANACPGHDGPCGLGVTGCTVCRPVTITALGDSARLAMTT